MADIPQNMLSFDEPFGDTNGRKVALKETSESYRQLLEDKINDLKGDASRLGKQALVIGGTLAAVYLLLEILISDDEPEVQPKNDSSNPIVIQAPKESSSWFTKAATSYAVTWALGLAREKLMEFLATQTQKHEVNHTNDTSK
ncbi:MAG: hypothetical protein MUE30_02985 [Spirosomaceae bacterium]|jgi:hypothetical protein|nr:hypothetical protein [Spirosomataceae bacterium]